MEIIHCVCVTELLWGLLTMFELAVYIYGSYFKMNLFLTCASRMNPATGGTHLWVHPKPVHQKHDSRRLEISVTI